LLDPGTPPGMTSDNVGTLLIIHQHLIIFITIESYEILL
jgi:hypothetical protein